jgi:cytochrome c-type biogenesis protein CcmH
MLCWGTAAFAAIDAFPFETQQQEARYLKLIAELRCLVCQNQNLADSNAELALDLRRQVHEKILAGDSDGAIIDYMVTRYGDFVLYRPPVRPETYLLWFGPILLFLTGGVALLVFVRRHAAARGTSETLSSDEQQRLNAMLDDNTKERR